MKQESEAGQVRTAGIRGNFDMGTWFGEVKCIHDHPVRLFNIGRGHWVACDTCRTFIHVGSNLMSWRQPTSLDRRLQQTPVRGWQEPKGNVPSYDLNSQQLTDHRLPSGQDLQPVGPRVRGQTTHRSISPTGWDAVWGLNVGSLARGVAAGLFADMYDWRNIDSAAFLRDFPTWNGRFTTLEFLQKARDHNAAPLITANVFGGGYYDWADPKNKGAFVCQTVNPGGLAADWVRYINFVLHK